MNNENEVMEKAPVLTKKDCVKGAIRWSLMAVTTFNYDTQLRSWCYSGSGRQRGNHFPGCCTEYQGQLNGTFSWYR